MELDSLSPIAGLAVTDGNFIVGDGTKWVAESGNTARTSLGLGTGDSPTFTNLTLTGTINDLTIAAAGATFTLTNPSALPLQFSVPAILQEFTIERPVTGYWLYVNGNSSINQDVQTTASPTFVTAKITRLLAGGVLV